MKSSSEAFFSVTEMLPLVSLVRIPGEKRCSIYAANVAPELTVETVGFRPNRWPAGERDSLTIPSNHLARLTTMRRSAGAE